MSSITPRKLRASALVASGLVAGGLLAGTLSAYAADEPTPTPSASAPASETPDADADAKADRPAETALTGDTLEKVKAAVLATYPGATFDRVETDSDGAYEAHITKADGTKVTVELGDDFAITGEEAGRGGRGGHGGGTGETALTGDTLDQVKAAVSAKYPGATFDRVETDSDGAYEAHITKADGTEVTVEVDKGFAVTGEESH